MVSYITEVVLFAVAMTAILFAIVLIRPSTSEDNYESAVAQFCVNNWGGGGGTTFRQGADNFEGDTNYYIPPF